MAYVLLAEVNHYKFFRVVPRAFARLYKTLDLPQDFRCSITDKASFTKSAGMVTLDFDVTYVYKSEMVVSWRSDTVDDLSQLQLLHC